MLYCVSENILTVLCRVGHQFLISSGGTLMLCFQVEHQCIILFWWDIDVLSCQVGRRCFFSWSDTDAPVCFQGQRITGAMEDCQNQQPVKQLIPLRCGAQCHRYRLSLTMNLQVT